MVPRLLVPDHPLKPANDLGIRSPVPQQRTQVVLRNAEQAGANLAVRSQADAIAVSAKRLADRRDDAKLAAAIGETPAARGGGPLAPSAGPLACGRL